MPDGSPSFNSLWAAAKLRNLRYLRSYGVNDRANFGLRVHGVDISAALILQKRGDTAQNLALNQKLTMAKSQVLHSFCCKHLSVSSYIYRKQGGLRLNTCEKHFGIAAECIRKTSKMATQRAELQHALRGIEVGPTRITSEKHSDSMTSPSCIDCNSLKPHTRGLAMIESCTRRAERLSCSLFMLLNAMNHLFKGVSLPKTDPTTCSGS